MMRRQAPRARKYSWKPTSKTPAKKEPQRVPRLRARGDHTCATWRSRVERRRVEGDVTAPRPESSAESERSPEHYR
jgi:hypothetical protein